MYINVESVLAVIFVHCTLVVRLVIVWSKRVKRASRSHLLGRSSIEFFVGNAQSSDQWSPSISTFTFSALSQFIVWFSHFSQHLVSLLMCTFTHFASSMFYWVTTFYKTFSHQWKLQVSESEIALLLHPLYVNRHDSDVVKCINGLKHAVNFIFICSILARTKWIVNLSPKHLHLYCTWRMG